MKAVRIHEHGGPETLSVEETERPKPSGKEVLIKMKGTSLNAIDVSMRSGELKLISQFRLPMTLGFDLVGEVVECGQGVTSFLPGDVVVAMTGVSSGAAAAFCCVDQSQCARLPDGVDPIEAAAVPLAASTALQGLRGIANLRSGQNVLISGASGGVGSFAVQLAKLLGARVVGLSRPDHYEYVGELGADEVVDYRGESVSNLEERFDVVYDCAAKLSIEQVQALTRDGGKAVTTRPNASKVVKGLLERLRGSFSYDVIMVRPRTEDLAFLMNLLKEGRLRPCLAKTFPLTEAAQAHRFFEEESFRGKLVLTAE